MRVLHVFTQPRSGGGSVRTSLLTVDLCRRNGIDTELFTRLSSDIPGGIRGRLHAAAGAIHSPASLRDFGACLDRFRPDLVHASELFPLISPAAIRLCGRRGIPVVMTCDDFHLTCPIRTHFHDGGVCTRCVERGEHWAVLRNCRDNLPESLINAVHNALIRVLGLYRKHVAVFLTGSPFAREWLVRHAGVERDRIAVLAHPLTEYPPTPADPAKGTYVAFAGRMVPEKGIDTLLSAAGIAGLPVKLSRNEHHFCTVDLPPGTDVVVTRGRDDLAEFYRGARILAVPSRWFETFGIVGAEAMSHGIPVVASRLGALSDLVADGTDGLLFTPGDAADLAAKLRMLWDDPALCRRLGLAGRRKSSVWTTDAYFESLLGVYRQAAASVR